MESITYVKYLNVWQDTPLKMSVLINLETWPRGYKA